MANIKSQKKRVVTNEKSRVANKAMRSEVRTAIKEAKLAKANNDKDAKAKIDKAVALIDKAQTKGIFKANKAAREKSSLMSTK